jgi:hypothetical protein
MNYHTGLGGNYGGAGGIGGGGAGTSGGTAGTASTGGGGGGSDNSQVGYSAAFGGAGGSGVVIIRYVVASDNTEPRGLLRYNTDLNDIEVYENSYTGWVGQDPTRNFGGHNLTYPSNTLSGGNWTVANLTVTPNVVIAPDGTTTASTLTTSAVTTDRTDVYNVVSGVVNLPYTYSVYLKAGNWNYAGLTLTSFTPGGGYVVVGFNLSNGTIGDVITGPTAISYGATITPAGNGWYRCSISGTTTTNSIARVRVCVLPTATGLTPYLLGYPSQDASAGYIAWTTTAGNYVNAWGGQLEQGVRTLGPYVRTVDTTSPVPTLLNGYRTHTYTTTGTSGFSPAVTGVVEVLVVAGGGGGGANHAAGGGAGGVLYRSDYQVISGQQYTVTVGAGGAVGPAYATAQGVSGSNSVFGTLVAAGGGGGGNRRDSGTAGIEYGLWGGSGGGGGGYGSDDNPTVWGGAGTLGQGYPGGTGSFHTGAGGGGAGGPGGTTNASAGASNTTVRPGNGGHGVYFPQFAHVGGYPAGWFGGGGAGNAHSGVQTFPATPGWGGGGWPQDQVASGESVNGRANTGGGGGGSTGSGASGGGAGGSGIVIVRYKN